MSSGQTYFDIRSVLGYWHSEFGDDAIVGGDVSFERASQGWSRDARGVWRRSFVDTIRAAWRPLFGVFVQVAMLEQARTQRVGVNSGLLGLFAGAGWSKTGDAASTFTRVIREDEIRRAGLGDLISDYAVHRLNNTAGVTQAQITATSSFVPPVSGIPYVASAFVRGSGTFNLGPENMADGTSFTATPQFRRYEYVVDSVHASARFRLRAEAGADIESILEMFEPGRFASSPIPNANSGGTAATRDGDALLFRRAPDPTDGLLLYMGFVLGANAQDLVGTTLMHIGTDDDPQATLFYGNNGDLVLEVRPGDSESYRVTIPLYTATREQFVEVAVGFGSDGALFGGAAIAGDVSRLAYLAEDSDGCVRFVGSYDEATVWLVEDSDGALRFSEYEPDPIIPIYTVGDALAVGAVMSTPPAAWSAEETWVGQSPLETDRTAALLYSWKHFKGDHVNPAHIAGAGDALGLIVQARNLVLGAGATPLGTGRSS